MRKHISDNVGDFFSVYIWLDEDGSDYYAENLLFLERAGIPKRRHIYVSKSTPTVIVLTNQAELDRASRDSRFIEWTPYNFEEALINSDDPILIQIGADSVSGTASPIYNDGMGYTGSGVKVGVISAENLTYIRTAKSLENSDITSLDTVLPPKADTHPTAVLSQIVGDKITVDGITFFGLARDAEAVFSPARTVKNVYQAIEQMAELGVRIINYSAGSINGTYSDFDRQIDRLIRAENILFVTVSGNTSTPTSPGLARNAVAVGNLVTKDYPDIPLEPEWSVWCVTPDDCSGFTTDSVHKPDLVAPGAWIGYVDSEGEINYNNFGTSFACPFVTGAAVLLEQASGKKYTYLTLKAILLISCDTERVSDINNPLIPDTLIRERSGYGLLDVKRAIDTLFSARIFEGVLEDSFDVLLEGNEHEIMLVFDIADRPVPSVSFDGTDYPLGEQNTLLIKKRSRESLAPLNVVGDGTPFSVVALSKT